MSKENKVKSLKELPDIVPTEGDLPMGWGDAEKDAIAGKLVRCVSWPADTFMWYRKPYSKPVDSARGLYEPCTKEWLQSKGIRHLTISGHWCRYSEGKIVVGWNTSMKDRMDDWEIYTQENSSVNGQL